MDYLGLCLCHDGKRTSRKAMGFIPETISDWKMKDAQDSGFTSQTVPRLLVGQSDPSYQDRKEALWEKGSFEKRPSRRDSREFRSVTLTAVIVL